MFQPIEARQRPKAARRLLRERRGAAALEFALVAIPFFVMIIGIMEVCWQLATGAALDHAALKASRFGATGTDAIPAWQQRGTPPADLPSCRRDGIIWMVSSSTGNLIRPGANLTVTTETWGSVGGITNADGTPNAGAAGAGAGSQISSYTIRYLQPFITGAVAARLWGGPGFTHQTTIVVKNEPFTNEVDRNC